ncbi:uncharacterized protein G2W53_041959 [Senna tora]|uniref:Uncharacterized protein n=1 Tax=Senna tora TaxID=362788 RepID=A0A834VYI2_9FABA|nr:uncharacterized protein G2W53_041959 [Senna tora]
MHSEKINDERKRRMLGILRFLVQGLHKWSSCKRKVTLRNRKAAAILAQFLYAFSLDGFAIA